MKQLDRFTFLLGERKKLIKVQATGLNDALARACHRYPGKFINYSGAVRIQLFEAKQLLISNIKTNKYKSMKMFSSCPENRLLIEEINSLVDERSFVLILVNGGNAYLLLNHHKFLNPVKEAKHINIGKAFRTEDGTYYFYEPMLWISETPKPKIKPKVVIIKRKKIKSNRKK